MIHLHWHRTVRSVRAGAYKECRCGRRKHVNYGSKGGHPPPLDRGWLAGGEFRTEPPPAPKRPNPSVTVNR